jgi:hypothetical protein
MLRVRATLLGAVAAVPDPVAHIGMFDDSPALQNVLNQLSSSPNQTFKATCGNCGQGI